MSVHVTDPTGVEWTVSRDWFGLPGWARDRDEWRAADFPHLGDLALADGAGPLGALVVAVAVVVVALVVVWFLLPLFVLLLGVLVALVALALRILSVTTWAVRATGGGRELVWRVRGVVRSRRAMHELADRLARGQEPTIDGLAGFELSAP